MICSHFSMKSILAAEFCFRHGSGRESVTKYKCSIIQTEQNTTKNTNMTKCKCKHDKIQMEQNMNTTKYKCTKIQMQQNTNGTKYK